MKIFFKLLFFAGFCLVFLDGNASKNSVNGQIIDEQNELYGDEMVFDGTVKATPDGENMLLYGIGRINLTLVSGTLTLEVCQDCAATSQVYFETTNTVIKEELKCSEFSSCCKFEVRNDIDGIYFGKALIKKKFFGGYCLQTTLQDGPEAYLIKRQHATAACCRSISR